MSSADPRYHRFFTHRSFKTPRPIAAILAALGSMAVEGPVLQWVVRVSRGLSIEFARSRRRFLAPHRTLRPPCTKSSTTPLISAYA